MELALLLLYKNSSITTFYSYFIVLTVPMPYFCCGSNFVLVLNVCDCQFIFPTLDFGVGIYFGLNNLLTIAYFYLFQKWHIYQNTCHMCIIKAISCDHLQHSKPFDS